MLGPPHLKAESPPLQAPLGDTGLHAEKPSFTALVQNLTLRSS